MPTCTDTMLSYFKLPSIKQLCIPTDWYASFTYCVIQIKAI